MAKKPPPPKVSPPAPFEQITDTETITGAIDTPDIEAFRAFAPDTNMLGATLSKNLDDRRRAITDSYGAYTGIPSQVARNRLRDEALAEVDATQSLALAEGSEKAQALKMAQLETLARLTGQTKTTNKGKQSGYNTSVIQPQQGPGIAGSLISGSAGVATAAIIA